MKTVFVFLTLALVSVQAREKSACELISSPKVKIGTPYAHLLGVKCEAEIQAVKNPRVATADVSSACAMLTRTAPGPEADLLQAKCGAEKEYAKNGRYPSGAIPYALGEASANGAVTKVTYRDATGVAIEASNGGARLKLALRREDRKEEVAKAKAQASVDRQEAKAKQVKVVNPCSWLYGCPVVEYVQPPQCGGGYGWGACR